jgi:predicted acetyltransferase
VEVTPSDLGPKEEAEGLMSETKPPTMEVIPVGAANRDVYNNLAQGYEAEFSAITGKKPDARGIFRLDTRIGDDVRAFLLSVGDVPAGLIAVRTKDDGSYEVAEFYVVPSFRKQAWGQKFAHAVWRAMPGKWEIKQIAGAEYAAEFWRKTIGAFPPMEFQEDRYDDSYWGMVTRQRFVIATPPST